MQDDSAILHAEVERLLGVYHAHMAQHANRYNTLSVEAKAKAAWEFARLGIPSQRNEAYRFANLEPLFAKKLKVLLQDSERLEPVGGMFECAMPKLDAYTLFFVNGQYFTDYGEQLTELTNGVVYGSLGQALKRRPDITDDVFQIPVGDRNDGLPALATMLAYDGIFIHVPAGVELDKPLQIIHLLQGDEDLLVNTLHHIHIARNARAKVVVITLTLSDREFLDNSLSFMRLVPGAQLDVTLMQNVHNHAHMLQHTVAEVQGNAKFNSTELALHGEFIRTNAYIQLVQPKALAHVNGLTLLDGHQFAEHHTIVDHAVEECESSQLFKHIVDGEAESSFYGIINVAKDAQHTQAYQRNANILLSPSGKVHTRPQLIIHADDVKCSHGATVGQLDEDARFYLQQRGIPLQEVNRLLMMAFAHDVLQGIGHLPLRDQVERLVEHRLNGEATQANAGCPMVL